MVGAPVPDRCIYHSVGAERHDGADNSAGETIIPVVVLVNGESTCDECRAEDGSVGCDELPHGRVVIRPDL